MTNSSRRDFVKLSGIMLIGATILPRPLLIGSPFKKISVPTTNTLPVTTVQKSNTLFGIIDMHCHPSQKLYLLNHRFWSHHFPRKKGDNLIRQQMDIERLQKYEVKRPKGINDQSADKYDRPVKGMIAAHYLPEMTTATDSSVLSKFYWVLDRLPWSTLVEKMEHENLTNFIQLNKMMNDLEIQIDESRIKKGIEVVRVVSSYYQFQKAIDDGVIPLAHSVEGSHSLGRIKPNRRHRHAAYLAQLAENKEQRKMYLSDSQFRNYINILKVAAYTKALNIDLNESIPSLHSLIPTSEYNITREYLDGKSTKDIEKILKKIKPLIKEVEHHIRKLDQFLTEEEGIATLLGNLGKLKDRGVCLVTLAHFFSNDIISYPVCGIAPDSMDAMHIKMPYKSEKDAETNDSGDYIHGISEIGRQIVNAMFDLGIIVDLTHTNPTARQQIFKINEDRVKAGKENKPIVFTHCGVQDVFENHRPKTKTYSVLHGRSSDDFRDYNVSNDEIIKIRDCHGVIGIIPEVFWLTGRDSHWFMGGSKYRKGIDYILETIRHIHKITGSYDNIAIGSDFDGLADAARDLYLPAHFFSNFTKALESFEDETGRQITPNEVRQITSDNALRVLHQGWT